MSKKITKITRSLMMVALTLSLLLGLGFALSPSVAGVAVPVPLQDTDWSAMTTAEQVRAWLEAQVGTNNDQVPMIGGLANGVTLTATTLARHGDAKTLNLNGNTLGLSVGTFSGGALTIDGGNIEIVGTTAVSGTDITLSAIGTFGIRTSGVTFTPHTDGAPVPMTDISRLVVFNGDSWGGAANQANITVGAGRTLEVLGPTFNRVLQSQVTFEAGSILYRPHGGNLNLDLPGLQATGGLTWHGTGTLSSTPALPDIPLEVRNGVLRLVPADVATRTEPITLNGAVLNLVNVLRSGSSLGDFEFIIGTSGGRINVTPPDDGVEGPALLHLNLGTPATQGTVFNYTGRPAVGRSLEIGGNAIITGWRTATLEHFFGPISLSGVEMRTTAAPFAFEDGKTLSIAPGAGLRTLGEFIVGSAAEGIIVAGAVDNRGTINLGGNFTVTGRSVLNNRADATVNLNNNTLTLAGSVNSVRLGTSFVNAGNVNGGAGSSIVVQGGPNNANAVSGSFVNSGVVTRDVDLTIGGSSNAAVRGAVVVNNGEMNLGDVRINGGVGAPANGQGGTLENNSDLNISGNLTVGRAGSAAATAGTLNNDGILTLAAGSNGTVQGGNGANIDAGVLTNSADAGLFLVGQLTLAGSFGHADAGAVEFTNEGELTVYNGRLNDGVGLLRIGAGSNSAPSAQMINEGSLVLGSDQLNWGRTGRMEFGIRARGDDGGTRATLVNDGEISVLGASSISVDTDLRAGLYRLGLLQNTADGLIRVTTGGTNILPTGTFENAGIVTFTADASRLTTPATDVFDEGIAIGVGPYSWTTVARGAAPFAGLGHRQILSVYGNGGTFRGRCGRLNEIEIHMTAGEARLVDLSVLANFGLVPTRGADSLVGWNTQRDGLGVSFAPGATVEVIGSVAAGQPNPDVIWAVWPGPAPAPAPGIPFGDIREGRWYSEAIRWAANTTPAIVRGFEGTNQFRPDAGLSRAQFVTMLYRLAGEPSVAGLGNPFTDVVSGRFYANAVTWAYNNNVVTGFSGTTLFRPNERMSREQVAVTLYRMAAASPAPANALHGFPDRGDVSPFAFNAVNWAVTEGIMGRGIGALRPSGGVSRAEAAVMIYRVAVEFDLLP